jgi:signal transduction histidine kinase
MTAADGFSRAPLLGCKNRHSVAFHDARFPASRVATFLASGLDGGRGALVVAAPEPRKETAAHLHRIGVDLGGLRQSGRLVELDADAVLGEILSEGRPSPAAFDRHVGREIDRLVERFEGAVVFGEMVDRLVSVGNSDAAIELERLWNELLESRPVSLLCAYSFASFESASSPDAFATLCHAHGAVDPGVGGEGTGSGALVAQLEHDRRALRKESERRRRLEESERSATSHILRLQKVIEALAEAITSAEVEQVILAEIPRVAGALEVELAVLDAEAGEVRVLGVGDDGLVETRRGLADPLPVVRAIRERAGRSDGATTIVPLVSSAGIVGALSFRFAGPAPRSAEDEALLDDLGRQAALALERARLYDRAQRSEASLVEANRRKDEFLALLSHELRNPLAPIMTALQLMKLRGISGAEYERDVIERQVRHVSRLVDDLLDLSRITRGRLELDRRRVDVASVISRAIETTSPLFEQRFHRLTILSPEERIEIDGDEQRLAQAVANLLTNAAKFTDPGGAIEVDCAARDGRVQIAVRDSGIGLSAEALATIFDPFHQAARPMERGSGGLGLGLSLVKSLVELHGGSVRAESDGPGKGSRFVLDLPALPAGEGERAEPPSVEALRSVAGSTAKDVLVVDDNPDAAESLANLLRLVGHRAAVAHDAAEALALVAGRRFDVAVLDIGLPVVDGYELARRLRGLPGAPRRFVAVTGYGADGDLARSRAAGFEAHLTKPMNVDRLLEILEQSVTV